MAIDHTLLDQMSADIESELAKKISPVQRRALQMDRLMVMFMRQSITDRQEIAEVRKASLGLWIQRNPKLALFLFTLYLILSASIDLRDVFSKALGL